MDKSLAESILSFISIFILTSVFTIPLFRGIMMIMNMNTSEDLWNKRHPWNKSHFINLQGSTWMKIHLLLSLVFFTNYLKIYMDIIAKIGLYVGIASPIIICIFVAISAISKSRDVFL